MLGKQFKLSPEEFRPLALGRGGCYATDHITVDGERVGYMYRELPDPEFFDSGWRFFSGRESDEYVNNSENISIYDVNTIANYDPEIIPFLDSPSLTAFARDRETGKFVEEPFAASED